MGSVVDICNKALSMLGQESIVSLSDDSAQAYACRILWPSLRDDVLRGYSWNCATKRVSLQKLLARPAFGFRYQYQLPTDCLAVLEIVPEALYEIEGRKLLVDIEDVSIRYVYRLSDSTIYDAQLSAAFSYLLAGEMAYQMTQSTSLGESLRKIGLEKLADAKATDSFEGKRPEKRGYKLLRAKYGGR